MTENIHIILFLVIYDNYSSLLKHMKHFLFCTVFSMVRILLPVLFSLLILSPTSSFSENNNQTESKNE